MTLRKDTGVRLVHGQVLEVAVEHKRTPEKVLRVRDLHGMVKYCAW